MNKYGTAVIVLAWLAPLALEFNHTDLTLSMYAISIILLIIGATEQHMKSK